ncbi:uncharacterized protein [Rutidosis leptorrhynchoides]|uniref:uncharacterized protein n=1 Tax=Rutidosis leptorrhynchoides TaxID=125765 RepID=UPI003A98DF76
MAYSSSDDEYTMLALEMLEADQSDEGDSSNRRGVQTLISNEETCIQPNYGSWHTTSYALDEYLQMSERVVRESLQNFTKCIIDLYANDYMREPTREDMERLYEVHGEKHDFPGMLGSIDCMQWVWRKCPVAWKG